ncbi:MAG: hypothetical protein CMM76_06965 [Rhodospirillaceae bacterium]|nr:hypothetical protein [Rhodospirillaceae bacterium]
MNQPWKIFLIFRLPLALLFLIGFIEFAAYSLSTTPKLRHPLDRLVANIDSWPGDSETVLLGDSVTQDVAWTYKLAPRNSLANLTTNQASGLIGSYLLLKRYLKIHNSPRRIVIASTPEFFSYSPTPQTAEIYLTTVFEDDAEINELQAAGITVPKNTWEPAVLNLENKIFDRIAGLMFAKTQSTEKLPISKISGQITKENLQPKTLDKFVEVRATSNLQLSRDAKYSVKKLCELSQVHKFQIVFIWAPVPNTVLELWNAEARLDKLTEILKVTTAGSCFETDFADINQNITFPDHAFRDPDHLKRPYWSMLYAKTLRNLLWKDIHF